MLVGIIAIGVHHTYSISGLLADPPPLDAVTVAAVVLLLVGALSKSASSPSTSGCPARWPPPPPVSAYLHAAAMVKAGIYLVALLAPIFAARPAGTCYPRPRAADDDRRRLAGPAPVRHQAPPRLRHREPARLHRGHRRSAPRPRRSPRSPSCSPTASSSRPSSSSSGSSTTRPEPRPPAPLGSRPEDAPGQRARRLRGSVDGRGHPDGRLRVQGERLESLWEEARRRRPSRRSTATSRSPPSSSARPSPSPTRAASSGGAFATKPGVPPTRSPRRTRASSSRPCCSGSACLALGLLAPLESPWLMPYAVSFPTGATPDPLALWHGVTVPLLLSLVSLGSASRSSSSVSLRPGPGPVPALIDGERGFARTLRAVDRGAVETTAVTQRGSLPIYLASILLVFVALPGMAAVTQGRPARGAALGHPCAGRRGRPDDRCGGARAPHPSAPHGGHARRGHGLPAWPCSSSCTVHPTSPSPRCSSRRSRSWSSSSRCAGCRRSSPGTLHSPSRTWRLPSVSRWSSGRHHRAHVASGGRTTTPVSVDFPTEAYNFGHGKNIVNVTLVDIRAWDTLGEVSVLVAAATGIASLIFVRTRNTRLPRATAKSLPASNAHPRHVAARRPDDAARRSGRSSSRWSPGSSSTSCSPLLALPALRRPQPAGRWFRRRSRRRTRPRRALSAGGRYELDEAAPFDAGLLVGLGLLVAVGSALAPPRVRGHDPRDHGRRLHPVALG